MTRKEALAVAGIKYESELIFTVNHAVANVIRVGGDNIDPEVLRKAMEEDAWRNGVQAEINAGRWAGWYAKQAASRQAEQSYRDRSITEGYTDSSYTPTGKPSTLRYSEGGEDPAKDE